MKYLSDMGSLIKRIALKDVSRNKNEVRPVNTSGPELMNLFYTMERIYSQFNIYLISPVNLNRKC